MKPRARLLFGPANCGKTQSCVEAYLQCLRTQPQANVIFLVPTALKVTEVKERILRSGTLSGIRQPRIMEFYGLAQRIIAASPCTAREISPHDKLLLIADIVHSQKKQENLRYFRPIAEFPGFYSMLGDFIAELKAAAVTPEKFADVVKHTRAQALSRDTEIASIYTEYQARLRALDLYDREGRLWLARDLLHKGDEQYVGHRLDLLIVDGFPHFSQAELDMVTALAARSANTIITLTYQNETVGGRKYSAVKDTYDRLCNVFTLEEVPVTKILPTFPLPLQTIASNLFVDTAAPYQGQISDHLEIIPAPNQEREVEEIAREIKLLLTGHQSVPGLRQPLRPDDILVIFRNLAEYEDRVVSVFAQFGLPVDIPCQWRLSDSPVVKTMLAALDALASGGERDPVLNFVKSSYIRFGPTGELQADEITTASLQAGIIRGLDDWAQYIRRFRDRLEAESRVILPEGEQYRPQSFQWKLEGLERAAKAIQALIEQLPRLPKNAHLSQFIQAVETIIQRFGIEETLWQGHHDWVRRDARALEQLRAALSDTERLLGDPIISLNEFIDLLHQICQSPLVLGRGAREGKVQLMDAHQSRQLHFPVVFVGGLSEKEFPRYHTEEAIYDDWHRELLARQGIRLTTRAMKASQEMLLFYSAVTRATHKLYLTYPLTDSEGREKLRSYFVDELLSLFTTKASERRSPVFGSAPPLAQVYRQMEAFNTAIYGLYQREQEPNEEAVFLYEHLRNTTPQTLEQLITAIGVENERESENPFGPYDGVLNEPAIQKSLSTTRNRIFSITQFNEYGHCPFRYFCEYILKVEPLEEPEDVMGAPDLGSIYHNILQEFYAQLKKDKGGDTPLCNYDPMELKERLKKVALAEFSRAAQDGRARRDALWRLQQEMIQKRLERFLDKEIELAQREKSLRRPAYFEVSFGTQTRGRDVASTQKSLELPLKGGKKIRICGIIDRIDLVGSHGPGGFTPYGYIVIDYKSGRTIPTKKEMQEGLNFQLPVYLMAAEMLLFPNLKPVKAFFYSIRGLEPKTIIECTEQAYSNAEKQADDEEKKNLTWAELRELALEYIRKYVKEITSGHFPVSPQGECHTSYPCPFFTICRYSESRHERKPQAS